MLRPPSRSKRTDTLFPDTTLFRSGVAVEVFEDAVVAGACHQKLPEKRPWQVWRRLVSVPKTRRSAFARSAAGAFREGPDRDGIAPAAFSSCRSPVRTRMWPDPRRGAAVARNPPPLVHQRDAQRHSAMME